MPISDIVNVSISIASAGFPRTGYGTALILSSHTLYSDRVRSYSKTADMVTDGFSATGPEVAMAAALFAQTPRPRTVKVGRLANRPLQSFKITPVAANSTSYAFEVNGNAVEFTSDGSGTAQEINTGLELDITALSISGITTTDGATDLDLDMSVGNFLSVEVDPTMTGRLALLEDTADPGLAADLTAIALADNDWYGVAAPWHSKAINEAIATYAESNVKLALLQTADSLTINNAFSGTDDVGESLKAGSKLRSRLVYHPRNDDFFGVAEAGRIFPTDPGSASWSDKDLAGVTYYTLTTTQRANATARNLGLYERLGDVGRTRNGKTSGGEWVDVVIARDSLVTDIQAAVYDVISAGDKLPYTAEGIEAVGGAIRGELADAVKRGVLASFPAPAVFTPAIEDVSPTDKANRVLTGVTFDAVLAGAIVAVDPINGALTA